ncbi:MAG: porin, partial [Aquitalea sp.]|nr:porin [Aquitalea sp.]
MHQRILITSLLCSLPALAMAEVGMYGSLRVGINSMKSADTSFHSSTGVDDYSSRLGVRGKEDLGNSLEVIWQVETGLALDGMAAGGTASGTLANRMSYVGLQGGWGRLRAGYIDDVLTSTQASDIMAGSRRDGKSGIAVPLYEARDIFGSNNYGDSRARNSLRYDSPLLGGLQGSLQYGAGEKRVDGKSNGDTWGLRLAYANAGYFANY